MADVKIQAIIDNIKQVNMSPSSLELLCEFEKVLDEAASIYAFINWREGELIEGPKVTAYRVECSFFWPLDKMPDPAGAARLLTYGVKVSYRKAWLIYPIKIKTPSDFRDGIKKPKLARAKVWIVTINMPKYLIKDIKQGSKEIMDMEIEYSDISKGFQNALADNDSTEGSFNDDTTGM